MSKAPSPINDPLHFARPEISDKILKSFESGIVWSTTIFAPRRKGKTQFLQRDLIPEAKTRGFLVAYADLWSNKNNPEAVISLALAEAIKDGGLVTYLLDKLRSSVKIKSARLDVKPTELSAGTEFEERGVPSIGEMFDRFHRASNGRGILVIDEVQHLATKPEFEDFTAALRSNLDRRRGEIFGVFTGSSQGGLTNLFGRTKAPFYQFASRFEFPDFGMDIVYHFGQQYQKITGRPWEVAEAYDLFCKRGRTPQYLRAIFQRCLTHQESPKTADEVVWQELIREIGYTDVVDSLSTFEKVVLRRIAEGQKIYTEEAIKSIERDSTQLGMPVVKITSDKVQAVLRKLERPKYGIVGRTSFGEYCIEDELLKMWILENIP